jgi:hypothetical protein
VPDAPFNHRAPLFATNDVNELQADGVLALPNNSRFEQQPEATFEQYYYGRQRSIQLQTRAGTCLRYIVNAAFNVPRLFEGKDSAEPPCLVTFVCAPIAAGMHW